MHREAFPADKFRDVRIVGQKRRVRLSFENELAGAEVDRFVSDVPLMPLDERRFIVTRKATVDVQSFGWLYGFGSRVLVLDPE